MIRILRYPSDAPRCRCCGAPCGDPVAVRLSPAMTLSFEANPALAPHRQGVRSPRAWGAVLLADALGRLCTSNAGRGVVGEWTAAASDSRSICERLLHRETPR